MFNWLKKLIKAIFGDRDEGADGKVDPPPTPSPEEPEFNFEEEYLDFKEVQKSVTWIIGQFDGVDNISVEGKGGSLLLNSESVVDVRPFKLRYDTFYEGPVYGTVYLNDSNYDEVQVTGYVKLDTKYNLPHIDVDTDGTWVLPRVGYGIKYFELKNNQSGEIIDKKFGDSYLVRSFKYEEGDPEYDNEKLVDRCYTYDQSLVSLMFTGLVDQGKKTFDRQAHRSIIGVISMIVNNNRIFLPQIGQDYNAKPDASIWSAPHNMGYPGYWETQHRTAIDGWVIQALIRYLDTFPDSPIFDVVERYAKSSIEWLYSCMAKSGDNAGIPIHGYNGWENGVWVEKEYNFSGIEGTLEAYHAFKLASKYFGDQKYTQQFETIKDVLVSKFWFAEAGRFYQGLYPDGVDVSNALDILSWGSIVLMDMGEYGKAEKSIKQLTRFISISSDGKYEGFRPFNSDEGYSNAKEQNVWYEGSFGVLLAYHKAYQCGICEKDHYEMLLKKLVRGKKDDGSFLYSTDEDKRYDFIPRKSVASTSWYVLSTELRDWMWNFD